jgi:catechol 2,3-dioxygenase-like lactoylglutathione lyase family enzyme
MIRVKLTSVFVDDQAKALEFYTKVLGLEKKSDFPAGEFRWLTVVSPEDRDGVELVLEPNDNPAARTFQQAIFEAGMPAAVFEVDDIPQAVRADQRPGRGVQDRADAHGPGHHRPAGRHLRQPRAARSGVAA